MFGRRVRYKHSFLSAESVKKHVILFSFRTIHDIIEWLWSLARRQKGENVWLRCVNATAKPNETERKKKKLQQKKS